MVPEQSSTMPNKIYNQNDINDNKMWLSSSDGISEIPVKSLNNTTTDDDTKINCKCDVEKLTDVINDLILEICDRAVNIAEEKLIMTRSINNNNSTEMASRKMNTSSSIFDSDYGFNRNNDVVECCNTYVGKLSRRSVSMCVVNYVTDENDNNRYNGSFDSEKIDVKYSNQINKSSTLDKNALKTVKKKKKISFTSLFSRKDKHKTKEKYDEEHSEAYDYFDSTANNGPVFNATATLDKSKKYASTSELYQKTASTLTRTPSFIKKFTNFGELKRSISFRDSKRSNQVQIREKYGEERNSKWRESLQSLVETDPSVSYSDLSFVDYDPLNNNYLQEAHFSETNHLPVGRTQSNSEKVSFRSCRKL